MKMHLISLGCGLLVGVIYSLLQVRSPAPPVVALVGLLGILLGEQALPLMRWMSAEARAAASAPAPGAGAGAGAGAERRLPHASLNHLFGELPSAHAPAPRPESRAEPAPGDRG